MKPPSDIADIADRLEYLALGPKAIAVQERRGQQVLVNSSAFPRECPRASLEAWGFVFGAPIDDLFVEVQLPEGWTREGAAHSLWTFIRDPEGRRRVDVFYKAAFYERKARATLQPRYRVESNYYDAPDPPSEIRVWADDAGTPLFELMGQLSPAEDSRAEFHAMEAQVRDWLDEHREGWDGDVAASWAL